MTETGRILCYVKVGWNEETSSIIRNETYFLKKLEHPFQNFIIPKIIYSGEWEGRYLCIQSTIEGITKSADKNINLQYLKILKELFYFHSKSSSLQESVFWNKIYNRTEKINNNYYYHILKCGIKTAQELIGNEVIPFHFCHGDFTPWNVKIINEHLLLFDWEYAELESLPGWDLFHFFSQTMRFLNKFSPHQIYKSFQKDQNIYEHIIIHLHAINISKDFIRPLLILYFVDRLSFYALLEPENYHTLKYFGTMINLLIFQEE